MSQQTGNEKIELVVLQGNLGSDYVRPNTIDGTPNTLDTEAKTTDFPLYEVHVNGLTLESITPLFTVLPDGGRVGTLENTLDTHLTTNDPHRIAFNTDAIPTNQFSNDNFLVSGESLKSIFEKLACTIRRVLSHVSDMGNPHSVGGDQLSRVVPISKGGTGATTAAQALANLGVPSTVAESATKTYVDNKISELQTSFQDGVDTIVDALGEKGYTPAESTPESIADLILNGTTSHEETLDLSLTNITSMPSNAMYSATRTLNWKEGELESIYVNSFRKSTNVTRVAAYATFYDRYGVTTGTIEKDITGGGFVPIPLNACKCVLAIHIISLNGGNGQSASYYTMSYTTTYKRI